MGAYDSSLDLYDVVVATESYSDSTFAKVQDNTLDNILYSNVFINEKIVDVAKEMNINITLGRVYSTDVFYHEETNIDYMNNDLKCLGTEMETFALFHNANHLGKKATAILTVSDHLRTGKETTPEEREKAFNNMIEIALNTTLAIENN
jgi:purine-nucleoside phosphorylase